MAGYIIRTRSCKKNLAISQANHQDMYAAGFDALYVPLSTLEGVFFFRPSQIVRLGGESIYTCFCFTDLRPLVIRIRKEYEDILAEHDYIRVHKSHLVHKSFIKHFDKEGYLRLAYGSQISVSRRRRE